MHLEATHFKFHLGMWAGLREFNQLAPGHTLLSEEQGLIQESWAVGIRGWRCSHNSQLRPARPFACACLVTSSPGGETLVKFQ